MHGDLLTSFSYPFDREKAKWKERDDAWLKIENLAKSNPQVLTFPSGGRTADMTPAFIAFIHLGRLNSRLTGRFLSAQFLMYHNSAVPDRPVDMETDGPPLGDINMLKKIVQEEATEVRRSREGRACSWVGERFFFFLISLLSPRSKRSNVESVR